MVGTPEDDVSTATAETRTHGFPGTAIGYPFGFHTDRESLPTLMRSRSRSRSRRKQMETCGLFGWLAIAAVGADEMPLLDATAQCLE